jgi:small conductance mechanosensitive channel
VIPNTTLISVPIKTYSSETVVKMMVPFWTHYDSDVNLVLEIIKNTVNSFDFIKQKKNTKVFLSEYLDSSLEFKAFISFDPNGGLLPEMVKGHLYEKINEEFEKNNIKIPYKITTVKFEKPEDKNFIEKEIQE